MGSIVDWTYGRQTIEATTPLIVQVHNKGSAEIPAISVIRKLAARIPHPPLAHSREPVVEPQMPWRKWLVRPRALVSGGTSQRWVVFSFHHVGRALSGVAEVTSIADLEDLDSEPNVSRQA